MVVIPLNCKSKSKCDGPDVLDLLISTTKKQNDNTDNKIVEEKKTKKWEEDDISIEEVSTIMKEYDSNPEEKEDENRMLPELHEGQSLLLEELTAEQVRVPRRALKPMKRP